MKIGLGFLVVLILTVVVGLVGYQALGNVLAKSALNQEANTARGLFADAQGYVDQFFLNSYQEGREKQAEAHQKVLETLKQCRRALSDMQSRGD